LTVFEATGRRGSFTRASNELALTQSALSKQVRQLEVTLGVVLFTRA
jgi:DNA-binding transcriptional LysR family regulator